MPLYEYKCEKCKREWEKTHKVSDRHYEYCCGEKAKLLVSKLARPVIYEYFSENLNANITGPAQKKRLMKEKNMREAG